MKTCSICKEAKDESQFFKDRHTKSGLDHRCKTCSINRVKNSKSKEKNRQYSSTHRKKFPNKVQARNKIHYHVKAGNIIRPDSCETCGTHCKPHAHHCDYSKPFEVMWLCKPCHSEWHRNNEAINA